MYSHFDSRNAINTAQKDAEAMNHAIATAHQDAIHQKIDALLSRKTPMYLRALIAEFSNAPLRLSPDISEDERRFRNDVRKHYIATMLQNKSA